MDVNTEPMGINEQEVTIVMAQEILLLNNGTLKKITVEIDQKMRPKRMFSSKNYMQEFYQ